MVCLRGGDPTGLECWSLPSECFEDIYVESPHKHAETDHTCSFNISTYTCLRTNIEARTHALKANLAAQMSRLLQSLRRLKMNYLLKTKHFYVSHTD